MSKEEKSKGGSTILRHEPKGSGWKPPASLDSPAEEIARHLERYGVVADSVFHEIVSDLVHVDVHICKPTEARPFTTLFTTGMADLPMKTPADFAAFARAELMICLPKTWPTFKNGELDTDKQHWPIGFLRYLARFPHAHETWLSEGHTIPNGNPPTPFGEGTNLCGVIIAPPLTLPEEAHKFETAVGTIHIFAVVFLHEGEMNLKLEKGANALYALLDKAGVSEILDISRKPVTRRMLFGIF